MSSIPEYLTDLARRARIAADAVENVGVETREELAVRVVRARTDAEHLADALHSGAIAAEREAVERWNRIQSAWKDHVLSTRTHIQDRQTTRDAADLARRAEYAERYAQLAAELAAAALQEAEFAALDAALAKADARQAQA